MYSIYFSTILPQIIFTVFRNYENPPVADESLQSASAKFIGAVHSTLSGQRTLPAYTDIKLDTWRHIAYQRGMPSQHRGHTLLQKDDLDKLKYLSCNWWYVANEDGDGVQVDFPIKAKPVLSWSPNAFIKDGSGNMVLAKRFPRGKICINIIRKPVKMDTVYSFYLE